MAIDTNVPPADGDIFEQLFRDNWTEIDNRIGTLTDDWTDKSGEILACRNAEDGPAAASDLTSGTIIKFFNHPVGNYHSNLISVTGSVTVTDDDHSGNVLECTNTSAIQLTITPNANPAAGVSTGFIMGILRGASAGVVQVVFGGSLTNQNIDGHDKVRAGMMATVIVSGTRAYFQGFTE